jgi:hypothetical protein
MTNRDAHVPPGLEPLFHDNRVPILCLDPLGAKLCPGGAYNTLVLPIGADPPNLVGLAIEGSDLPHRVCLDWSYALDELEGAIQANAQMELEELAVHLANEFGSVAALDDVSPERLRVFCNGQPPANPLGWSLLRNANDGDIFRHKGAIL